MSYQHGIKINEVATPVPAPKQSQATITVAIGTAPVNLIDNPSGAVNRPIVVASYDEAKAKIGYSDD